MPWSLGVLEGLGLGRGHTLATVQALRVAEHTLDSFPSSSGLSLCLGMSEKVLMSLYVLSSVKV